MFDSYAEDGDRIILKLDPKLAPYKAAVFPLLANKPGLVSKAREIYDSFRQDLLVAWDDRGNIGKRYFSLLIIVANSIIPGIALFDLLRISLLPLASPFLM